MLKLNLLLAEYMTEKKDSVDRKRLKAIQSIKELLDEVDHKVEQIPEDNIEMLTRLLTSLKGEKLTLTEIRVVEEIVGKTR